MVGTTPVASYGCAGCSGSWPRWCSWTPCSSPRSPPCSPTTPTSSDLSKTGAGVLTAAYPAGTFVGALPSGWLATRWGVKPTLLTGLALLGLASLGFAFAHTIVLLDTARFIQGVGGACMWAAGMAWLSTAAPPNGAAS